MQNMVILMFVKHKLKGTEELPFFGHSVVFDKHQNYHDFCLKMFHKVSLVWQLYRPHLRSKVTIPGKLCRTNRMADCWKSHSLVYIIKVYILEGKYYNHLNFLYIEIKGQTPSSPHLLI